MKKRKVKKAAKYLTREMLNDLRMALVISSLITPFIFLAIIMPPLWVWLIYWAWFTLVAIVNMMPSQKPSQKPRRKKPRQRREFATFKIGEDDVV